MVRSRPTGCIPLITNPYPTQINLGRLDARTILRVAVTNERESRCNGLLGHSKTRRPRGCPATRRSKRSTRPKERRSSNKTRTRGHAIRMRGLGFRAPWRMEPLRTSSRSHHIPPRRHEASGSECAVIRPCAAACRCQPGMASPAAKRMGIIAVVYTVWLAIMQFATNNRAHQDWRPRQPSKQTPGTIARWHDGSANRGLRYHGTAHAALPASTHEACADQGGFSLTWANARSVSLQTIPCGSRARMRHLAIGGMIATWRGLSCNASK